MIHTFETLECRLSLAYDAVPNASFAEWISLSVYLQRPVRWRSEELVAQVHALAATSVHYVNAPQVMVQAIEQVLSVDVRSLKERKKESNEKYPSHQSL